MLICFYVSWLLQRASALRHCKVKPCNGSPAQSPGAHARPLQRVASRARGLAAVRLGAPAGRGMRSPPRARLSLHSCAPPGGEAHDRCMDCALERRKRRGAPGCDGKALQRASFPPFPALSTSTPPHPPDFGRLFLSRPTRENPRISKTFSYTLFSCV